MEFRGVFLDPEYATTHALLSQVSRFYLPTAQANHILQMKKPFPLTNYLKQSVLHLLSVVWLTALWYSTPPLMLHKNRITTKVQVSAVIAIAAAQTVDSARICFE